MIIVVNSSSPFMALARIGYLQLLPSLYQEVCIPIAVQEEVVTADRRAGAEELNRVSWVRVVT